MRLLATTVEVKKNKNNLNRDAYEKSTGDSKRIDHEKITNHGWDFGNSNVIRGHDGCHTPTLITNDKNGLINRSDAEVDGGKQQKVEEDTGPFFGKAPEKGIAAIINGFSWSLLRFCPPSRP